MGKKKTKQTNEYQFYTPPTTPQQTAYENSLSAYDTPDPSIPYTFNNARESANNRLDTPFGANYSPEVSDAIRSNNNSSFDQMQGQAIREDSLKRQQLKSGGLATNAGMTAPQFAQSGGTQTVSDPTALFGSLLSAGGALGGAALGNPALM